MSTGPLTLKGSERAAEATRTELHNSLSGSDTYEALLYSYGRWMPERRAQAFAREHGTTVEELDTDLYWRNVASGHAEIHCASLLAALGY